MSLRTIFSLAAALVIGASACSGADTPTMTDAEARAFAMAHVSPPDAGLRVGMLYRTLDEALPNVAYVHPVHGERTFSDLAVVGTITGVQKGKGWIAEGAITDFDSDKAGWRSLHMTVAVQRAIGSSNPPKQVRVAIASPPPDEFDAMAQGLKAMGTVVLLLEKDSPLIAYDPSLYVVVEDGGLWATVGPDDALDLPFTEPQRRARLLAATPRLSDLERLGASRRVVPTTGERTQQKRLDAPAA